MGSLDMVDSRHNASLLRCYLAHFGPTWTILKSALLKPNHSVCLTSNLSCKVCKQQSAGLTMTRQKTLPYQGHWYDVKVCWG